MTRFCEHCGRRLIGGYIELPQDTLTAQRLAEIPMIEDPTCLRFCTEACKKSWGHLRQLSVWSEHGAGCMCPECMG